MRQEIGVSRKVANSWEGRCVQMLSQLTAETATAGGSWQKLRPVAKINGEIE